MQILLVRADQHHCIMQSKMLFFYLSKNTFNFWIKFSQLSAKAQCHRICSPENLLLLKRHRIVWAWCKWKRGKEWGIKGNGVISAMFYLSLQKMTAWIFLKLRLWFSWHFSWYEFTSQVGMVATVVRDVVVVVLPSFTTALCRGIPFLYPNPSSPSPIISSYTFKGKLQPHPQPQKRKRYYFQRMCTTGKCADRVLGILVRQIKLSLEVYINTHYNDKGSAQPGIGSIPPIINSFCFCAYGTSCLHTSFHK